MTQNEIHFWQAYRKRDFIAAEKHLLAYMDEEENHLALEGAEKRLEEVREKMPQPWTWPIVKWVWNWRKAR